MGRSWSLESKYGLPAGTVPVGAGLAVFGVSTYVFLALAARRLSPDGFAALSTLWVLVYTGGPGVFLPFEQAVGRTIAAHRAQPEHERQAVRALVAASVVALIVLLIIAAESGQILTSRLFDGSMSTYVAFLLAICGMWAAYLTRGMFAGHDRYNAYGAQLAIEGIARMAAGFVVVALAGSAGGFALGLSAALLISVVFTLPGLRGGHRRSATVTAAPESPARRTQLTILAWMILGGLMMQILVNLAPVIVKAAPHQSPGAAGHYLGGLMLARLPLFVFAAVQAALLPGLAHTVADGDREGLRRQLFGLFALIGASMSLFTIALAVAGPSLVDLVYGNRFGLGRSDLVLLAVGTGTAMAAMVVSSAVVAVGAPGRSALMWTAAVAVLAAVLLLPGTLFWRLEISYLAGAAAALAGQLIALLHRTGTAGSSAAIVRGRT